MNSLGRAMDNLCPFIYSKGLFVDRRNRKKIDTNMTTVDLEIILLDLCKHRSIISRFISCFVCRLCLSTLFTEVSTPEKLFSSGCLLNIVFFP